MQNKFEFIVSQLEPYVKQGQTHFTLTEILQTFELLTDGLHDRDHLEQIYQAVDKDKNGRITLLDFAEGVINSEQSILNKLADLSEEIDRSSNEIGKNQTLRDTHKLTERLTEAGIATDSTLNITIGEINLNLSSREVYVECEIEGAIVNTKTLKHPCSFNQNFALPVTEGGSKLTVTVKTSSEVNLAHTSLPLEFLKDQMEYEQAFSLFSMDRRSKVGGIELKVQWIWSKSAFFQHMLELWQENLHTSRVQYSQLKKQACKLLAPFKLKPDFSSLVQDFVESPESSFWAERESPSITFKHQDFFPSEVSSINQSHSDNSAHTSSQVTSSKQSVMNLLSSVQFVSEPSQVQNEPPFEGVTSPTLMFLEGAIVATSMCLYMRPDFFSLVIVLLLYISIQTNKLTYTWGRFALKFLVLSLAFDLLWFTLHSKDWGQGHNEVNDGMRRFALGMSGIGFVMKVILGVLLWFDLRRQLRS
mmetsp:Transcript_23088/g.41234  ORF Transcript_23088/g.41234 Transcript_23088/m.41234 type:complete len:475 (-) Transcript_23088:810-2234(-)